MRFEIKIYAVVDAKDEADASDLADKLAEDLEKDREVVKATADDPEPVEEDQRDEDYERAVARARNDDFEDTDGRDWS